jgi:hypothetical protein
LLSCKKRLRGKSMDGHGIVSVPETDAPLARPAAGRKKHRRNGGPEGLITRPQKITRTDLPLSALGPL